MARFSTTPQETAHVDMIMDAVVRGGQTGVMIKETNGNTSTGTVHACNVTLSPDLRGKSGTFRLEEATGASRWVDALDVSHVRPVS